MKRFILLTVSYIVILFGILSIYMFAVNVFVNRNTFLNHETESNLLVLKEHQTYDLVLMGISHARNFSRHQNHLRIEQILNQKIINLGQGNGTCGVNEQLFYLDYFYFKGNTSTRLIYFISPPLFFSDALALSTNTFDQEPFNLDFLKRYWTFSSEQHQERMISYFQSKYHPRWLFHQPFSLEAMDQQMTQLDLQVVEEGQRLAYGDTLNKQRFQKSRKTIEESIHLALSKETEVILIIPPALFGQWDGHQEVVNFATQMAKMNAVSFYDFSETVKEPKYYYDHHHLNTAGIVFFTANLLKPILD